MPSFQLNWNKEEISSNAGFALAPDVAWNSPQTFPNNPSDTDSRDYEYSDVQTYFLSELLTCPPNFKLSRGRWQWNRFLASHMQGNTRFPAGLEFFHKFHRQVSLPPISSTNIKYKFHFLKFLLFPCEKLMLSHTNIVQK